MKKSLIVVGLSVALILGLAPLSFSQKNTPARSASLKWEYCLLFPGDSERSRISITFSDRREVVDYTGTADGACVKQLNKLGQSGWEIVTKDDGVYTLKRRK